MSKETLLLLGSIRQDSLLKQRSALKRQKVKEIKRAYLRCPGKDTVSSAISASAHPLFYLPSSVSFAPGFLFLSLQMCFYLACSSRSFLEHYPSFSYILNFLDFIVDGKTPDLGSNSFLSIQSGSLPTKVQA